jgi:hypothetical protein
MNIKESLGLRGRVEIIAVARRTGEVIHHEKQDNIILYQGNAEVIKTLFSTNPATKPRVITRQAIGDQGTIPADPQVAKVPVKGQTALFHEIYRKDVDSSTQTILGTNVNPGDKNECLLIATFNAVDIPLSAYSNPSQPRVNEVGLIVIDPTAAGGLTRAAVSAPTAPDADEVLFSIRCFKSIPFDIANDVSITIRYTVFLT